MKVFRVHQDGVKEAPTEITAGTWSHRDLARMDNDFAAAMARAGVVQTGLCKTAGTQSPRQMTASLSPGIRSNASLIADEGTQSRRWS